MDIPVTNSQLLEPAGARVRCAIRRAQHHDTPYHYWTLRNVLPADLCHAITTLPYEPPPISDTLGRRETHNALRTFVSESARRTNAACAALAEAWQDEATTALIFSRSALL